MKLTKGQPKMADSILKTRSVKFEDMFGPQAEPEADEPEAYAEGGEVKDKKPDYVKKEDKGFGSIIMEGDKDDEEPHYKSVADAIRAKGKKKMAEGGMVEDEDAALKEDYSDFSHLDDIDVPEEDDSKMSVAQKIRSKK
jgi:hypothetical protein